MMPKHTLFVCESCRSKNKRKCEKVQDDTQLTTMAMFRINSQNCLNQSG